LDNSADGAAFGDARSPGATENLSMRCPQLFAANGGPTDHGRGESTESALHDWIARPPAPASKKQSFFRA